MMYEIRTTRSRFWSDSLCGFPSSENNLMGWSVAADVSGVSPLGVQRGPSAARRALEAGRAVSVYINPAHLIEVIPLG